MPSFSESHPWCIKFKMTFYPQSSRAIKNQSCMLHQAILLFYLHSDFPVFIVIISMACVTHWRWAHSHIFIPLAWELHGEPTEPFSGFLSSHPRSLVIWTQARFGFPDQFAPRLIHLAAYPSPSFAPICFLIEFADLLSLSDLGAHLIKWIKIIGSQCECYFPSLARVDLNFTTGIYHQTSHLRVLPVASSGDSPPEVQPIFCQSSCLDKKL